MFDGSDAPDAADAGEAGTDRVESAIRRLYDADRFTRHLAGVSQWLGRQYGLDAPQTADPSDADFRAAAEVVHRRLMDSPLAGYLDRLSNQAIEDLIVVLAGFGPLVKDTAEEAAQKKRARRAGTAGETEGDTHDG